MATQHQKLNHPILVVGAGVLGLSVALLLQEKFLHVTIVAAEFPIPSPMSNGRKMERASVDYASMWAGAHYRPIPHLPESEFDKLGLSHEQRNFHSQLAYEKKLAMTTAKQMKHLAHSFPESGVRIVHGEEYLESPPAENLLLKTGHVYASENDDFKVLNKTELDAMDKAGTPISSNPIAWGCTYETYVVNVHLYSQWLLDRFLSNGGKTIKNRLSRISDAFETFGEGRSKPNIVVNCSGRNLDQDFAVKPIRGQTVLVRNEYDKTITRQCADGTWSFLIPRPLNGGTIVGGTKEIDDFEAAARPETRRKLLENAAKYFPGFVENVKDFDVVTDNVGRRPWRSGGLRIEREDVSEGTILIHGYGAGGRGYELSWGAAEEMLALVKRCFNNESVAAKL